MSMNSSASTNVRIANTPIVNAAKPTSKLAETTGRYFSSAKKFFTEGSTPIIILIVVTILVFILVILWISFSLQNSNLKGKLLTTTPIKLDTVSKPVQVSAANIPIAAVGREYTFAFWLYLEDFDPTTTINHKIIFYRGVENTLTTANPIVFLDGTSNKMYIAIKTQGNSLGLSTLVDYNKGNLQDVIKYNYFANSNNNILITSGYQTSINLYLIMVIDYIPLQRWVNIVTMIDNKIITLYMDGEIYSVKTAEEFKSMRTPEINPLDGSSYNPTLIVDKSDGDIFIGKSTIIGGGNAPNGYLSRLEYFNYALSINEVRNLYSKGPIANNGFMSGTLNIPYGVRSPIYSLADNIQKN